jgi:hypothetical protein
VGARLEVVTTFWLQRMGHRVGICRSNQSTQFGLPTAAIARKLKL